MLNLAGLTNIVSANENPVYFYADATNGLINLSGLLSFTQIGLLDARSGGAILAPNLQYVSGVSLYVDAGGTLALPALNWIDGGDNGNTTIEAAPGAVLNLSSVRSLTKPDTFWGFTLQADAGALLNLSGLTNITGGSSSLYFNATSANGVINLLGPLTFTGPGTLSQANGGLILLNTNLSDPNVTASFAPAIITPPQNTAALYGANVTFSVVADGTPPLSYQWFFNQTNAISGATTPALTLFNLTESQVGAYTVVITNSLGSVTSTPALFNLTGTLALTLLTNGPGTVQVSPAANLYPYDSVVTVTATPGPGDQFLGWSGAAAGAANPLTLTLTSNTVPAANFTVVPPQIRVQPFSHTVVAGSPVTLNVSAVGTLPLSYQWWFNGTNLLSGQTASNLTLLGASASTAGRYSVVISNSAGVVTSGAARISVMTPTIYWTGVDDGRNWTDAGNWNTGVLPTAADSIFIGATNETITVSGGLTVSNLLCESSLTLNGSLNVAGAVDIAQSFSIPAGDSITVNGTNGLLIAEGSTAADAVSMYVGPGGLISFPGLTNINNSGDTGSDTQYYAGSNTLEAGPDAVPDLSSVRQLKGPGVMNYGNNFLQVQADAGATVNLSGVTNVFGVDDIVFIATATNSVINLSSLLTFTQLGSMEAGNGGTILAANLKLVQGVSLYLDDAGSALVLSNLTAVRNPGGSPVVTLAANPGALLDLSSVRQISAVDNAGEIQIMSYAAALVNLGGVTNISGNVDIYADSTNGVVNLDGLQTFSGPDAAFEAYNGGQISATNLNSISGVELDVDAYGNLALTGLTTIEGSGNTSINANVGARLNLSSVRYMQGSPGPLSVYVDAGALVDLSGVTNIVGASGVGFYADSPNGVITSWACSPSPARAPCPRPTAA